MKVFYDFLGKVIPTIAIYSGEIYLSIDSKLRHYYRLASYKPYRQTIKMHEEARRQVRTVQKLVSCKRKGVWDIGLRNHLAMEALTSNIAVPPILAAS